MHDDNLGKKFTIEKNNNKSPTSLSPNLLTLRLGLDGAPGIVS